MLNSSPTYHPFIGSLYVFNLIVGIGALAIPYGFYNAGWLLSLIVIIILAFMSFMSATFVIESMSVANLLMKVKMNELNKNDKDESGSSDLCNDDLPPLNDIDTVPLYEISRKVELGEMARLFFSKMGTFLFYLIIVIYLFGDLSIYAATIGLSLNEIKCKYSNSSDLSTDICWENLNINRKQSYQIFVSLTFLLLGPFAFFNIQKSKYLQLFTTLMRWIAFLLMIILASIALYKGKGQGQPKIYDFKGLPNLFGTCVYSFMCHHSLPVVVTPFKTKKRLFYYLLFDYLLVLLFYCVLSFTGIFTFSSVEKLYSLNFLNSDSEVIPKLSFIQHFLPLFPVFVATANFPILSITLNNNLLTLFSFNNDNKKAPLPRWTMFSPFLALIPSLIISLISEDVAKLIKIVGSYSGACIQYIIPAFLVYQARKISAKMKVQLEIDQLTKKNEMSSPFKSNKWIAFILIWSTLCIAIVTFDKLHITNMTKKLTDI